MKHEKPSWSYQLEDGRNACLIFTTKEDGDLSTDQDPYHLARRQRSIVDEKWTYLKQVHGAEVIQIESPGQHQGRTGDALFKCNSEIPISIQTDDCAPVALVSPLGSLSVVHAGWKGLVLGVIDKAVNAMSRIGKRPTVAVLGPCIYPSSYEFGEKDIKVVSDIFGDGIRSETEEGNLALNLPKTVEIALDRNGISELVNLGECTSDSTKFWSYRLRKDHNRQATVGWIESRKDYVEKSY